jgi:phage shock protein A
LASQRRIQRQLDEADKVANEWYNRAQLALRQLTKENINAVKAASTERLAREALLRREMELERKVMIQKQLDTQSMATEQLYNAIVTLEQQIQEVMLKQQQLVARARTAEATKQIQSMIIGQFDTSTAISNSMNAFNRMEQKVEAMEAAVDASIELNQGPWSTSSLLTSSSVAANEEKRSLEQEFRYLEQTSKIDEELEYLKNQLNNHDSSPSVAAIGPSTERPAQRIVSIPIQREENIFIS